MLIYSFNPHSNSEGDILILILWMRTLKFREVKYISQAHIAEIWFQLMVGSVRGPGDLRAGLWQQEQLRRKVFSPLSPPWVVQGSLVRGEWISKSGVASWKGYHVGNIMVLVCGLIPNYSNYQLGTHRHLEAIAYSSQNPRLWSLAMEKQKALFQNSRSLDARILSI